MGILYTLTIIMLVICSVTDIRRREISLPVVAGFLVAGIIYRGYRGMWWQGLFELIMRFAPGLIMLVVSLFRKEDIGIGDAVLVIATGYTLGAVRNIYMLMAAAVVSGIYSVIMLVLKKMKKGDTLPFVPFLLAGCILLGVYLMII